MAQNGLRRIFILLIVQPIYASEIRDAALRGDAGTAEKDDVVALGDHFFQLQNCIL